MRECTFEGRNIFTIKTKTKIDREISSDKFLTWNVVNVVFANLVIWIKLMSTKSRLVICYVMLFAKIHLIFICLWNLFEMETKIVTLKLVTSPNFYGCKFHKKYRQTWFISRCWVKWIINVEKLYHEWSKP